MALSDTLNAKRQRLFTLVNFMTENVKKLARDVYSPKGANWPAPNSLAGGIVALNARRINGVITGTVVSSARSRSGFDYAKFQHERTLAHVTFMPRSLSFVDFGSKGNRSQRYSQGYKIARRGAPRFKADYLNRAGAAAADDNAKILRAG